MKNKNNFDDIQPNKIFIPLVSDSNNSIQPQLKTESNQTPDNIKLEVNYYKADYKIKMQHSDNSQHSFHQVFPTVFASNTAEQEPHFQNNKPGTSTTKEDELKEALKNFNLAQFVERLCTTKQTTDDNVVDIFIGQLVSYLLNLTDVLVNCKPKIQKILSALIEIGFKSAKKNEPNEYDGNNVFQISSYKSVEYKDSRLNDVYALLTIDKQIQQLTKKKFELYPKILNPNSEDIINLDCDEDIHHTDNTLRKNESENIKVGSDLANSSQYFSQDRVEKICTHQKQLLKAVKQEIIIKTDSEEMDLSGQTFSPVRRDWNLPLLDVPYQSLTCSLSLGKLIRVFDLPKRYSLVINMKIYKNICIAACNDGCLVLFSIKNGRIVDLVVPHEQAITSLTLWNQKLITGSLDGSMKCYNLSSNTVERLVISHKITCSEEKRGKLYLGTLTGHMYCFDLRYMLRENDSIQVASSEIFALKMFQNSEDNVIVISSRGNPITLRDASTGALMKTLKTVENVGKIVLSRNSLNVYYAKESNVVSLNSASRIECKHNIGCEIILLEVENEMVMAVGSDNNIYFFTKELNLISKMAIPPGKVSTICITNSLIYIGSADVQLSSWLLPQEVSQFLQQLKTANK